MDLIKLLDLANPKKVKDTINSLLTEYASFTEQNTEATNQAISVANQALNTANNADTVANAARANSETAMSDAQAAVNTSIEAKETSDEAYAFATDAFTNSEDAVEYSDQAFTNANEAVRIAEAADALSIQAQQESSAALNFATEANTKSDNVVEAANAANTKSDEAISTANTANSTANTALSTANSALANSETAIDIANTAKTNAETALTNSEQSVSMANAANTKADNAVNVSNDANTKAANAVLTANNALELIQAAYANSEAAVNTANNADTNATTALNTANTALTNSSNAVNTANIAEDNSNTAMSNASTALANSNTALSNSENAVSTSDEAKRLAQEAVDTVVEGAGTQVTIDGVKQATWESNVKANRTDLENAVTVLQTKNEEQDTAIASKVDLDNSQTIEGMKTFQAPVIDNAKDWGTGLKVGGGYLSMDTHGLAILLGKPNANSSLPFGAVILGGGDGNSLGTYSVSAGMHSRSGDSYAIAIGYKAKANSQNAIQLGQGINNTAKSLQIYDYQLLDGNTGKIPNERLNISTDGLASEAYVDNAVSDKATTGYVDTKAQTTLSDSKVYTDEKIDAIIGEGASETLDTIGEISKAIEENEDVVEALNNAIGNKADKTELANYLPKSGGTVGSLSFEDAENTGLIFKGEGSKEYFIYGFGVNYFTLYTQIKDEYGNAQTYKFIDELGKLYSGNTEVAVKSDIPTVNNATLTIQKNGTNVGTFTANASSNSTVNIEVPTATSQLTNDSEYITNSDIATVAKTDVSNEFTEVQKFSSVTTEYLFPKYIYAQEIRSVESWDNRINILPSSSDAVLNVKVDGNLHADYFYSEGISVVGDIEATENITAPNISVYNLNPGNNAHTIQVNGSLSLTGAITADGNINATAFNATSDLRLKENIKDYKCSRSILDLPVKEFDYKKTGTHSIGCIAQDLQEICPEIVNTDKDGYLSIQESKLVYLLLQEVKELKAEIDKLKEV